MAKKIKKAQSGRKVAYTNPNISDAMLNTMSKTLGLDVQHSDESTSYSKDRYGDKYAGYDYIDIDRNVPLNKYPKRFQEAISSNFGSIPENPNRFILKDYIKD